MIQHAGAKFGGVVFGRGDERRATSSNTSTGDRGKLGNNASSFRKEPGRREEIDGGVPAAGNSAY